MAIASEFLDLSAAITHVSHTAIFRVQLAGKDTWLRGVGAGSPAFARCRKSKEWSN